MAFEANDNNGLFADARHQPDAHGLAALLLVESLLHSLIEKSVISVEDALDIAATATEVSEELATGAAESATTRRTPALLETISRSLESDIPR